MVLLNDALKDIKLFEVLIVLLVLMLAVFALNIDDEFIYVGLILYFIFKLRNCEFRSSIVGIFSKISFKFVLLIVLVNVFFSYGMLYAADLLISHFPNLSVLANSIILSLRDIGIVGGFLSSVVIAPVSEELLFRGVFLNRLKLVVPTSFAILISSIAFGFLHGFGSIIAAFVFGICMCIIYLKTDNILLAIFAHFLNNLFAELLAYIDYGGIIFTNPLIILIFSICAIVSLYLLLISIRTEWNTINNK